MNSFPFKALLVLINIFLHFRKFVAFIAFIAAARKMIEQHIAIAMWTIATSARAFTVLTVTTMKIIIHNGALTVVLMCDGRNFGLIVTLNTAAMITTMTALMRDLSVAAVCSMTSRSTIAVTLHGKAKDFIDCLLFGAARLVPAAGATTGGAAYVCIDRMCVVVRFNPERYMYDETFLRTTRL